MCNVPGRKTDPKDCQWIAELREYGAAAAQLHPGGRVAALRQRTCHRKRLIEARSRRLAYRFGKRNETCAHHNFADPP